MKRWIAPWIILGAAWALSFISFIGVLVIPFALAGTLLVAFRRNAQRVWPAAIVGAALPSLYVAWLHRQGPGTVCHALAHGGQECEDMLNPLPWLVAGVTLFACGVMLLGVALRRTRTPVREA